MGSLVTHLFLDRFCSEERIATTAVPLLLVHGREDDVIPCTHSEALHRASPAPDDRKTIVLLQNVDHNNLNASLMVRLFKDFLTRMNLDSKPELMISKKLQVSLDDMSVITCTPSFFGSSVSSCPGGSRADEDD